MLAGHDFDALLIGALYGELSAVEESRLQAHLAAHPTDQQIMRELTRTREAIRESAVLAIVEPPQAISALLLQEAARRAPKVAVEPATESGGRWMRFFSFLAHPALAAAAMVVVVVGVFGTMYLRNEHQVSESLLSAPAAPASKAMGAAQPAPSTTPELMRQQHESAQAGLAEPSAATTTPAEPVAQAAQALEGNAAAARPAAPGEAQVVAKVPEQPVTRSREKLDIADSFAVGLADGREIPRRAGPTPSKASKKAPGYITVQPVDELTVKDFDDALSSAPATTGRDSEEAKGGRAPERLVKREESRPVLSTKPAAETSAPKPAIVTAPPPPPAAARSADMAAPSADMAANQVSTSDKLADAVTITNASDDKWAKSEHVRLVRLARANKCAEVASGVRTLSERASRYYQDQVANDRELRICQAAIRDQLNLQSEQAKRKRARSESEAPATKKK